MEKGTYEEVYENGTVLYKRLVEFCHEVHSGLFAGGCSSSSSILKMRISLICDIITRRSVLKINLRRFQCCCLQHAAKESN
jgi:hypothetical protein